MSNNNYTKDLIIELLKEDEINIETLPSVWLDDKDIVLEAVKKRGHNLYFASERLKNEREVVLEAVKNNNVAIVYSALPLIEDKYFILSYLELLIQSNSYKSNKNIDLVKNEKILKKILLNKDVNNILLKEVPEIFNSTRILTIKKHSDLFEVLYNYMNKLIIEDGIKNNINSLKNKTIKF